MPMSNNNNNTTNGKIANVKKHFDFRRIMSFLLIDKYVITVPLKPRT